MINPFKKKLSKKLGYPKRFWNDDELSTKELNKYKDHFTQISGKQFTNILNNDFTPFMHSIGFKGNKNHFYRLNSPWIFTLQLFKDKNGGACAVNVGIHLDFVETIHNKLLSPHKFRTSDCILKHSNAIHLNNGNNWLHYGKTNQEAKETARFLIDMVQSKALPFFQQFNNFPHPFSQIKVIDLLEPNAKFTKFGITAKSLKWVHFKIFLSRINKHIGNNQLAIDILETVKQDEFYQEWSTENETVRIIDHLIQSLQVIE